MTERHQRAGRGVRARAGPAAARDITADGLDAIRHSCLVAAESAACVYRGCVAVGRWQQQAGREALDQHLAAAQSLRDSRTLEQVVQAQARLLRFQAEHGSACWQRLAAELAELQGDVLETCAHCIASDELLETLADGSRLARWLLPQGRPAGAAEAPG